MVNLESKIKDANLQTSYETPLYIDYLETPKYTQNNAGSWCGGGPLLFRRDD